MLCEVPCLQLLLTGETKEGVACVFQGGEGGVGRIASSDPKQMLAKGNKCPLNGMLFVLRAGNRKGL